MGRLPKNAPFYLDAKILKIRHRHADTRYRSNMQYLYSKLKEMLHNEAAKDSLLNVSLLRIKSLESEITQKVGSDEMKDYQNDFVNFLLHEEALWKIKDTVKWWRKVEEALNPDFIDSEKPDFTDICGSNSLNLHQENVTTVTKFPQVSSCCNTRTASQTSDVFSVRPIKDEKKLLSCASDFSENSNVIPCLPKFNENLFLAEEPDYLLSFEEQYGFSNEISAEPVPFETNLFCLNENNRQL